MKKLALILTVVMLTGCSTVKKYWPRAHDPALMYQLAQTDYAVDLVNCDSPDWKPVVNITAVLSRNVEWRDDPQTENIKGLHSHAERMNKGGSKMFCELGKKTAKQRIEAAKSAWEGR